MVTLPAQSDYVSALLAEPPERLFKFDFDPVALRKKYDEERDKRKRSEGNDRFIWMQDDNEYSEMLKDPWMPEIKREAVQREVRCLVIGGGFSGIIAGRKLREPGIDDFVITEKGGDYAGTWYYARYPGAACDSESYCYLPYLEETQYMPRHKYAYSPEILEHCQRMGKKWNLYENTLFGTAVQKITWDETRHRWICETDRKDTIIAQFVHSASGPLHKAKLAGVPGIPTFKGRQFHSSRWDYSYTGGNPYGNLSKLSDKRVAIVGTGATAVQIVPTDA